MARNSQTAGQSASKAAYTQYFDDHEGNSALRIGTCMVEPGASPEPPTDYPAKPVFCFQAYTSVELGLDDARPATKCSRSNSNGSGSAGITPVNIAKLKDFIAPQIHEAECPDPIWEVYTLPGGDAFAFVDHARREIAHRTKSHNDGIFRAPLIPKMVLSDEDERKTAFLIGIDAESGWAEAYSSNARGTPVWVHFDARVPAHVMNTEHALRLEDAPGTMGLSDDEIRVWPEQVDITIRRVLNADELAFQLTAMLALSCASEEFREEDMNLGMEYASRGEDLTAEESGSSGPEILRDAAAKLRHSDLTVTRNEGAIIVTTGNAADAPDLRYTIYVPFLTTSEDALAMLEDTAKVFTNAVSAELASLIAGGSRSVHFDFHIPLRAGDAAIVAAYREAHHTSDYCGAVFAQESSSNETPRRLQPLHINPHITLNDPTTCEFEPYKTFIVIIDSPDFLNGSACVRFLLADGGKPLDGEDISYLEGQAWRSAGMREVARRLALMGLEEAV